MPASNAPGFAHFPAERFPSDNLPESVIEKLPVFEGSSHVTPTNPPMDAPGLADHAVELFPAENLPGAAWEHLPFADFF